MPRVCGPQRTEVGLVISGVFGAREESTSCSCLCKLRLTAAQTRESAEHVGLTGTGVYTCSSADSPYLNVIGFTVFFVFNLQSCLGFIAT